MNQRVYVVAGELSGDIHGCELMSALKKKWSGVEFAGWGGAGMKEVGGEKIRDWVADAAVVGVWEVLRRYSWFKEKFEETLAEVEEWKPDVLLLVDYPGFNLRLAKAVKEKCPEVKIVHYVAPQVWAWNRGRVPKVAASHDLLLCLFPFEREIFEEAGLKTVWVGHPLVDELEEKKVSVGREEKLVAFLPGSRTREVSRLFPLMLEAGESLMRQVEGVRFEAAAANENLYKTMQEMLASSGIPDSRFKLTLGGSQELMQRASCGVVASGTATLEAGYYGLPYCLVYAVAWPTYLLGRQLVKVKHLGLINILAGRGVVDELIQGEANEYELSLRLRELLTDDEKRESLSAELLEVTSGLGESGVHERGAEAIVELFDPEK